MEEKRNSDAVQEIIKMLEECNELYEVYRKEVNNMDRLRSDIEHKFELKDLDEQELVDLGRELQTCLWTRRRYKDLVEELELIKKLMEEYPKLQKRFITLYNDLRHVEKQHENRYYKPRIMGISEEKWFSENNDKVENINIAHNEIVSEEINEQLAMVLAPLVVEDVTEDEQDEKIMLYPEVCTWKDEDISLKEKYTDLMNIKFKSRESVEGHLQNKIYEIKCFFIELCGDNVVFDAPKIKMLENVIRKAYSELISSYDKDTKEFDYSKTPTIETLWKILDKQRGFEAMIIANILRKYLNLA